MAVLFESVIGITRRRARRHPARASSSTTSSLVSTLFVISIPIFVIGAVAQLFFGVRLGLFPVTAHPGHHVYQLILPAFVLASASLAYIARLTRTNLAENLRADYVRTAMAKGLTRRRAVGRAHPAQLADPGRHLHRHRLRRAARRRDRHRAHLQHPRDRQLPLPQHRRRDGASVVGTVTCLVIVYLFVNLLVDLLYGLLDPRICS